MTNRTPHWMITARFFLICAPVGIILALLLLPFAIPILFGFFITLSIFWGFSQVFTNTVVKIGTPKEYKAIKKAGGNPFYDSLGAPLNFDSEATRVQGAQLNSNCPDCRTPMNVFSNQGARCPSCDLHWHENNWWRWTGTQWVLFGQGRVIFDPTPTPTKQKPHLKLWNGQNIGKT